ncbi:hypothetical protein LSM04_002238 [Trypanosoma melophagium]|uniref:uncharacterized protein n=1 Tax=Trypanosoma melophagium TaxID=715481 RepID=UPI003519FF92|nr:hypothetical protein LSM04_002238 [Trypanosoma melophagium]
MASTSTGSHTTDNYSSASSSSFSTAPHAGLESAASDTTRNFILGLPKSGPVPGSSEAASLQAAEAFIGEIQREILAYDIANARAMEAYAQSWWNKIPYFGKRWAMGTINTINEGGNMNSDSGRDINMERTGSTIAATAAAGTRDHVRVERASAENKLPNGSKLHIQKQQEQIKMNSWLFKQRHPGWVPIIQRRWVPVLCVVGIGMIWTPDVWKLRALYWCDHKYAIFRQSIHKAYWRATMSAEDYATLIKDMEEQRPTSVKVSNCPL